MGSPDEVVIRAGRLPADEVVAHEPESTAPAPGGDTP
jgi:hypothetical protein